MQMTSSSANGKPGGSNNPPIWNQESAIKGTHIPGLLDILNMDQYEAARSWLAWQVIRRVCRPLYIRYFPGIDLLKAVLNMRYCRFPLDVFQMLLTHKNYNWRYFVAFLGRRTSNSPSSFSLVCYRHLRKTYPLYLPTWYFLLRRRLLLLLKIWRKRTRTPEGKKTYQPGESNTKTKVLRVPKNKRCSKFDPTW